MSAKVVDASAVAAVLFGEPEGGKVSTRLGDDDLLSVSLLPYELMSVCNKKRRVLGGPARELVTAFAQLFRMRIQMGEVDHGEVLALAELTGLTTYDASYLWLSRRLGLELVTLDRELARIAKVALGWSPQPPSP